MGVAMGSRNASAIGQAKGHGTTFVRALVRARQHRFWAVSGGLLSKSTSNPRSDKFLEPSPSRETFGLMPRVLRLVLPAWGGHHISRQGSAYPSCCRSRLLGLEHSL